MTKITSSITRISRKLATFSTVGSKNEQEQIFVNLLTIESHRPSRTDYELQKVRQALGSGVMPNPAPLIYLILYAEDAPRMPSGEERLSWPR